MDRYSVPSPLHTGSAAIAMTSLSRKANEKFSSWKVQNWYLAFDGYLRNFSTALSAAWMSTNGVSRSVIPPGCRNTTRTRAAYFRGSCSMVAL